MFTSCVVTAVSAMTLTIIWWWWWNDESIAHLKIYFCYLYECLLNDKIMKIEMEMCYVLNVFCVLWLKLLSLFLFSLFVYICILSSMLVHITYYNIALISLYSKWEPRTRTQWRNDIQEKLNTSHRIASHHVVVMCQLLHCLNSFDEDKEDEKNKRDEDKKKECRLINRLSCWVDHHSSIQSTFN